MQKFPAICPSNWRRTRPVQPKQNSDFRFVYNIHKISLENFSEQLTLIDSSLFNDIQLEEFYRLVWSNSKNKHRLAPNIMAVIGQFNRVSRWAVYCLVSCLHFDQRVNLLRRFLTLAQHLIRINNFNCGIAILSALSNAAVTRLKHTWDALGEEFKERVAILGKFSATDKSYAVLRGQLRNCSGSPCVPYLGLYIKLKTVIEFKSY